VGLLSPDAGRIRVFGEKPEVARLRIGYVPQYVRYDPQFPISVFEVVSMGRLGRSRAGIYTQNDRDQTMESLAIIGLSGIADRPLVHLRRAAAARALVSEGDILILDEPTANIDHESEQQFFDLLTELNKRMTILMVTHEVGFATTFFKRIACVNKQVVIHPTSALTGDLIREMYGGDLQMIRHDHCCCSTEGHRHD
jgi:zinc transport system ATP-binding protein